MPVKRTLRNFVRRRARGRCEYCHLPAAHAAGMPFQLEHIFARQHGGPSVPSNLAFACHRCNLLKGPNLSSIDPLTGRIVRLFHPRRMAWDRHFLLEGPLILGRTAIGRATVRLLETNEGDRVELRATLIAEGLYE